MFFYIQKIIQNLNFKTSHKIFSMKIIFSVIIFFHFFVFGNGHFYQNSTDCLSNCSLCNSGFRLDFSGNCTCGVSNCDICSADEDNNSICYSCSRYFSLQNSDYTGCKSCYLDDCTNCSLNSQSLPDCLTCIKGYYLQNNTCVPCSDVITGCSNCRFNDTSLICESCVGYGSDGEYFSNGTNCIKCGSTENTKKCVSCYNLIYEYVGNSDPFCNCEQGYQLINGICQICSLFVPNCEICGENGKYCHKCYENYYSHDVTSRSSNCSKCKNDNCSFCPSGEPCLTCKSGYFLNNSDHTCILCSEVGIIQKHCIKPVCFQFVNNVNVQSCDQCQSGFVKFWEFYSNKEELCVNCSENLPNCFECLKIDDGFSCSKCLSCQSIHGNLCSRCNATHCLSCNSSYFYLLANLEATQTCSDCANTEIMSLVLLNETTYCLKKNKTTILNFTSLDNTISFNVSCAVNPSRILFIYGPKIYVQNLSNFQNDVLRKLGSKQVHNIPSTSETQWGWVFEAEFTIHPLSLLE